MAVTPSGKVNRNPVPIGASTTAYVQASDINPIVDALTGATGGVLPPLALTVTGGTTARTLADHIATLPDTLITATGSTTARTLAARAAQEFNILDFNAPTDGTSGATTAINAAINAASAAGGGLVRVPFGTFVLDGTVLIKSNVILAGYGPASILKSGVHGGWIQNASFYDSASTDHDIHVRELTRDSNNVTTNGVILAGVTRGSVTNVRIKNGTGYGLWIFRAGENGGTSTEGMPSRFITVTGCHISEVTDVGIEFSGAQDCTASGNTVDVISGIGALYAWNGAKNCSFIGNIIRGTGATPNAVAMAVQDKQAWAPQQTDGILFSENIVSNIWKGLVVKGTVAPKNVSAIGNLFVGHASATFGMEIDRADVVTVRDNVLDGFLAPLSVSEVSLGNASGQVLFLDFTGNTIRGSGVSNSCFVYGVTGGTFQANTFHEPINHAVKFYACSNLVISNNFFRDIGSSGTNYGMILYLYSGTQCIGNILSGNKTMDSRGTKYTGGPILLADAADWNICTGNSARGAKAGAFGVVNSGTGVNNVIANNVDAP